MSQSPPPPPSRPVEYALPEERDRGNGFALASVILGAVGVVFPILIFSVLAIIFGALGLGKTKEPGVGGKGKSIAGIILGGVGILLVPLVLMIAIMLPALTRARETANRIKCGSNMRQIGQAMLLYANENGNVYPATVGPLLLTQDISPTVFLCPSTNDSLPSGTPQQQVAAIDSGQAGSYLYFGKGLTASAGADTVLLTEPPTNHGGGGEVLFGDGHVAYYPALQKLVAELKAGQNPPPSIIGKPFYGGSPASPAGR